MTHVHARLFNLGRQRLPQPPQPVPVENRIHIRLSVTAGRQNAGQLLQVGDRIQIARRLLVSVSTVQVAAYGRMPRVPGDLADMIDVIGYGEQAAKAGLTLLEAPGNDAVSSSALAAAGATMILFTTGRGTPLGFPVPTLKVASNQELARNKPHWIDFDASQAVRLGNESADEAFLDKILAVASGEKCAAERAGQRAIAIWKRGVTL